MIVLPNNSSYGPLKTYLYTVPTNSNSSVGSAEVWRKPPCSWVSVLIIGSGGNGGAGGSGAAGTARTGGGGGGSGGVTRGWWYSGNVPDILWPAISTPVSGNPSQLTYYHNHGSTSVATWISASSGSSGSIGSGGGAGGSGPGATSGASSFGVNAGIWHAIGGQTGGNGGVGAAGANIATAGNTRWVTGGAGGGGTTAANADFAGGNISTSALITTGVNGGAAATAGSDGFIFPVDICAQELYQLSYGAINPFGWMLGGAGGGSSGASGTGGRGGHAAIGCGGGGGGAGVTGGAGGNGGSGMIFIVCG